MKTAKGIAMNDVPDTTPEERLAAERKRLATLAKLNGGSVPESFAKQPEPERERGSGRPSAVVCNQTDEVFPSISALAKALKLNYATVYSAIQAGRELNGMTYSFVTSSAKEEKPRQKPISKPPRHRASKEAAPAALSAAEPDRIDVSNVDTPPATVGGEYKGFVRIAFVEVEDCSPATVAAVLEQIGGMFRR